MYIVQCIDYTGYSTRTLCAVCEECSVFAIHYKYIVEGLRRLHFIIVNFIIVKFHYCEKHVR